MEIRDDVLREAQDANGEESRELSRRERERLMRRHLMLDAARAVFAEKGYADATLDEIAQRAEFGKGTLYNYFEGGKEEILFAIFDRLYDELCGIIEDHFNPELIDQANFRAVFERLMAEVFRFFTDRGHEFMIMMKEGHRMVFNEQPDKAAYFQEQSERIVSSLVPGIEAAIKIGILRNFPAHSVAHMILGNAKGYHMHKCMAGCYASDDERRYVMPTPEASAEFLSSFLLDGMLAES